MVPARRRRSTEWCAVAGALLVLPLGGCGVGHSTSSAAPGSHGTVSGVGLVQFPVAKRTSAPALAGTSLDGHAVSLADVGTGKVVFVNVWASWCAPCRQESPVLAAAAKSLGSRGVAFLGLDEDYNAAAGRRFATAAGVTYPQLGDRSGSLLRKVGVLPQAAIPSTVVIDRHGRIAAVIIGAVTMPEIDGLVGDLG